MMWIVLFLITPAWFFTTGANAHFCDDVLNTCLQNSPSWTRCYEEKIISCRPRGRLTSSDFIYQWRNSSQEAEVSPTAMHRVHIPSSALQRSREAVSKEEVLLVVTVINSTYFKQRRPPGRARMIVPRPSRAVMGGLVLAVKAGKSPVKNLLQPIKLTFKHKQQAEDGTCVFWDESELDNGTGDWSTDGCNTSDTGTEFICSCDHLSFFAVLVNPVLSVDKTNAVSLSYITYVGSALSILFIVISLIIYTYLQRRRPEKVVGVHMHLAGALLCLHLSFLLCISWVRLLKEKEEGWVCRILGLSLHWSLLATFSWTALEGFHLYLLLVRVFNIYVRRYLLKLSLVGWGLPALIAAVCGISGVYGKYSLEVTDDKNRSATAQMCWMSSEFPQRLLVSYITTVALPGLVILCNSCMLGVVVFKLRDMRGSSGGKVMSGEKGRRLRKDGATVLGLSCVLGLPWGLASTTYISLPGIYTFTVLNSLQGVFLFLWAVALTRKSRSDHNSSSKDPSSQKMTTTSFNN